MKKVFISLLLSVAMLVSCDSDSEKSVSVLKSYFDLNNYFSSQSISLTKTNTRLQKKITKDGKTEEKLFKVVDWQRELQPFSDCDINKPSWTHSYLIDTVILSGVSIVKYISSDQSLPVQQVTISIENNTIKQIEILKKSANSYYHSNNHYIFVPDKGFTIIGSQDVVLAKKTSYSILATFVN